MWEGQMWEPEGYVQNHFFLLYEQLTPSDVLKQWKELILVVVGSADSQTGQIISQQ